MRDFQQRKNEILQRSAERIRARKRRWHMVVCTVAPLIFIFASMTVLWPKARGKELSHTTAPEASPVIQTGKHTQPTETQDAPGKVTELDTQAIILYVDAKQYTCTDPTTVEAALSILDNITSREALFEHEKFVAHDKTMAFQIEGQWKLVYTVNSASGDPVQTEYMLFGNFLRLQGQQICYPVSEWEMAQLLALLKES